MLQNDANASDLKCAIRLLRLYGLKNQKYHKMDGTIVTRTGIKQTVRSRLQTVFADISRIVDTPNNFDDWQNRPVIKL